MAIKELSQLKKFGFQKQITFAYLSCERVYPNYIYFSSQYKFGNANLLSAAIAFVYESIFNNSDFTKVDLLLHQVEANAPRPDNFDTFYASIAMNAAGVIYESVNLLKQTDISRILDDISTMCIDAIDLFIQERDDMDYNDAHFEEKILNDSLMQNEISIQKGIISYLAKIRDLNSSDIDILLKLQEEGSKTLIF